MTDIVLITSYMRPEFLSLCLEYLSKAEGARDGKEFWLCHDFRKDDDHRHTADLRWLNEVIENSPLPLRVVRRAPHMFPGNSYNTLEAYKEAYETKAEKVFLVEDDCLVTEDFFRWHEAVQTAEPNLMCSVGYRCIRNSEARKDVTDPAAFFVSARDYASIGVCWRREELGPVVEHARPEYYANPGNYLDTRFPSDVYSGWYHEQDGAIMRILHEQKKYVAWSYVPRIYHVGNIGYHRPSGVRANGQLRDKIQTLRSWIHDANMLKIVAPDFGDIEPVPTEPTPAWSAEDLYCVQRFE